MNADELPALSLYIHIPFCQSKCGYCDFNSFSGLDGLIPEYIEALLCELRSRAEGPPQRASTIYFGGGTPSRLSPSQIARVMKACRTYYEVTEAAEISLEANPGSVTSQGLRALRETGFNRLSLGVQSLDDGELRLLGRVHSARQAAQAYALARGAGFDNLNIDLIYGLPGQSLGQWQGNLSRALDFSPEHFSLYPLTLEAHTLLGRVVEAGTIAAPDCDVAAEMYEWAEERLEAAGYEHYELSNWARPGRACRHNLTYWKNLLYLGFGAGAHSCAYGYRWANLAHPAEYISRLQAGRLPEAEREVVGRAMEMSETLILGLRLREGVDLRALERRFGVDGDGLYGAEIEELQGWGLLARDGHRLRLTRRGRLLGNEVFGRFLPKGAG